MAENNTEKLDEAKKPEESKESKKNTGKEEKEVSNRKSKKKKEEKTDEKGPVVTKKKKARRRIVENGNAYIQASYNNTIVTLTEPNGNVIAWSSAGASGFKGARKSTPYAAQISAENAAEKSKVFGLERVHVYVKGVGAGREQAIRGLVTKGINILSISDLTPIPHNGCRKKKTRRP